MLYYLINIFIFYEVINLKIKFYAVHNPSF